MNKSKRRIGKNGIVFSFEATIAILFFGIILITLPTPSENSLKELLLVQQENDLLKIWGINFPSESEMIEDTQLMFKKFDLFIDNKQIFSFSNTDPEISNESIASEGIIVDEYLVERKIRIVVYE